MTWGSPQIVEDVDLRTGTRRAAPLLPETFKVGCPRLSADGKALLYTRQQGARSSEIMLSRGPDGRDAEKLTDGEAPHWLPSGSEFVFLVDARRAALFTMPNRLTYFPEAVTPPREILEIAVNDQGTRAAILYRAHTRQPFLEIYDLPLLDRLQHIDFDLAPSAPAFDGVRKSLLLVAPDAKASSLAELSDASRLTRVGAVANGRLSAPLRTALGLVFATAYTARSISLIDPDGKEFEVSRDSADFFGGVPGPRGDVLLGAATSDGRQVIAHWKKGDKQPHTISAGPTDLAPSFSFDGNSVVYIRRSDNGIVQCPLSSVQPRACRLIHVDSRGPVSASLSPDGQWLVYSAKDDRVRVVSGQGGEARELPTKRFDCKVRWSKIGTVWIYEKPASGAQWAEFDPETRRRAGRTQSAPGLPAVACEAPLPDDFPAAAAVSRIRSVESVSSVLRMGEGL